MLTMCFQSDLPLLIDATREEAAVYNEDLACNKTARLTCQENCRTHQLFSLSEAVHRGAHLQFMSAFALVQ